MAGYLWVLYFVGALLLLLSKRANKAVALGLCCMGAPNLILFCGGIMDAGEMDWLASIWPFAFWGGLGLVVIGAISGGRGTIAGTRFGGYLSTSFPSLASLVIPRDEDNSFTRAEKLRDDLYDKFTSACEEAKIAVTGYKSPAQSAEVWLRFDYQLPQEDPHLSLRSNLLITIERLDYHRFEHVIHVEMKLGAKTRRIRNVIHLSIFDINAINEYLAGKGSSRIRPMRIREYPLQLWRPLNKVTRIRPDWLIFGLTAAIILLIFIPLIGWILAVCGGVVMWLRVRRRKIYVLTTGKPLGDPRNLVRMDSWQANIGGLGTRQGEVREVILSRLESAVDVGISVVPERIWYAGIDGKVEREQVVVSFRRAIAFVHLKAYGDDLYVGWDSHVNAGTWVEETLSKGIDRRSKKLVVANRVVAGWQPTNEYDVTDVNFLTEWLHATLTRIIRLKMEEYRIDQEIDFTVQRESRRTATQREQSPKGRQKGKQKRVGVGRFMAPLHRVS